MTTAAAAQAYLADQLQEWAGKGYAIHNPHAKQIDELPVIYGFNNGGSRGWMDAVLIAESGHVLGSHICSDEGYMPHDLGVVEGSRPDRHKTFREHYPDGYRMDFVRGDDVKTHPGIEAACQENAKLAPAADAAATA
jgi:hypothetical protein